MNKTAKPPETRIRSIPLCLLALAPENVRKTPSSAAAQNQLKASITAHGLIENLLARADGKDEEGQQRYAVIAGGRRLAALQSLADDGAIESDHPVPCRIAPKKGGVELSLAENVMHDGMHPADQVTAFTALAYDGMAVSAIAVHFGVTERTVEQRLRLGNAAPELIEAYREGTIDLETLKAFAVTADRERQLAAFAQVSSHGYRITPWQVKRLLTEERVPASAELARFVGVEAYEAAGGPVLRDLFADEEEHGVWFEDPALLEELASKKLQAEAKTQSKVWKWAEARIDIDWSDIARFGRIRPQPSRPTAEESAEIERLNARLNELANTDEDDWTEALEAETETNEARLEQIGKAIEARAQFRAEDHAIAGCIVTVGRDGELQRIEGLVKPEDMPKKTEPARQAGTNGNDDPAEEPGADPERVQAPSLSGPRASPVDPRAKAREAAGVGVGLADDTRAIRTALVKAFLAKNFAAAFDLMVYQLVRSVFVRGLTPSYHALDIVINETADRPHLRGNDANFGNSSPGESMLADWSSLPLDWMKEEDEAACFAALRALPVARLGIDFARYVRPTADLVWSRLRKDRILAIARQTLGPAWAQARAKYSKTDLAQAMEEAFCRGPAAARRRCGRPCRRARLVPAGFCGVRPRGGPGRPARPRQRRGCVAPGRGGVQRRARERR